jgi:hypothetical protein
VHLAQAGSNERPEESVPAIVDTGATYSLFHSEIGRDIGFDVEAGRYQETIVSNGETMEFFVHRARLWIGPFVLNIDVGFGEDVSFPVLGRIGFFQQFRVSFDHGFFEIVPNDIGKKH